MVNSGLHPASHLLHEEKDQETFVSGIHQNPTSYISSYFKVTPGWTSIDIFLCLLSSCLFWSPVLEHVCRHINLRCDYPCLIEALCIPMQCAWVFVSGHARWWEGSSLSWGGDDVGYWDVLCSLGSARMRASWRENSQRADGGRQTSQYQ